MNRSQETKAEDFPLEVKQWIRELHESVTDLKQCLNQYNDNYLKLKSQSLSPLLKAKMEWTNAYAINSLFWIYLTTKGVDPQEHPIKQEIIRLKTYGERLKQIEDKEKALKVDTKAANRFIRSALWEPNSESIEKSNTETKTNKRKFSDQKSTDGKESIDLLSNSGSDDRQRHKKFKK